MENTALAAHRGTAGRAGACGVPRRGGMARDTGAMRRGVWPTAGRRGGPGCRRDGPAGRLYPATGRVGRRGARRGGGAGVERRPGRGQRIRTR